MDLQALRHCPEFEPRSNKGPVGLKIHSLSLGKIHLECKICHNWVIKSVLRVYLTSHGQADQKLIGSTGSASFADIDAEAESKAFA